MAARMQAVNDQALNHFVTDSPWDVTIVRQRLARRLDPVIGTQAWAIDDTGWLKCGAASHPEPPDQEHRQMSRLPNPLPVSTAPSRLNVTKHY